MICIFCLNDRPPSIEHVIPLALGGTITTDRVCSQCNSALGSRVDAALINFLPVKIRRGDLAIAGRRAVPSQFDLLEGDHEIVGSNGRKIRTSYDPRTGKLDHRSLYHSEDVVLPDGRKLRRISIDARDASQIPKIIQRERKRHHLPPLAPGELEREAANFVVESVQNPQVNVKITASFAFLPHALFKIAYELAFIWLGERYIFDPRAKQLREAICSNNPASTDSLAGYVQESGPDKAFKFWAPHEAHHLAYSTILPDGIVVAARIFDLYEVAIRATDEPERYIRNSNEAEKLRFLAIDSVSGTTVNTSFFDEQSRIARMMVSENAKPPFRDPISALEKPDE